MAASAGVFDGLKSYLEAFPFPLPIRTKVDILKVEKYLREDDGNALRVVDFLVAVAKVS
jgi:hypothetical protein